jgi:hypothetical protein
MPLTSNQLAALVERAKQKAPVVSPPPVAAPAALRPARTRQPVPEPAPRARTLPPPLPSPAPPPVSEAAEQAAPAAPDDFPTGWELSKDSWHFHRRFYAIFRRPMRHGEYSHLLHQIRGGHAEHLWEDCWRVRLPGTSDRTLPVRATRWRLITILPKHWQPPKPRVQSEPPVPEAAE